MAMSTSPSLARRHPTGVPTQLAIITIALLAAFTALVVFGVLGMLIMAVGLHMTMRSADAPRSAALMRALSARRLTWPEAPQLVEAVRGLAAKAGLTSAPNVALVPMPTPNAFATGSGNDAVLAVTPALLRIMSPRQLVGVLAHEVAHLRGTDLRLMAVAGALSRFIQTTSMVGTFAILLFGPAAIAPGMSGIALLTVLWAPSAATLLLLALSRSREYQADADAVALTGDPEGLAQALRVLDRHTGASWEMPQARSAASTPTFLRTHPPTEARVERLRMLSHTTIGPTSPSLLRAA